MFVVRMLGFDLDNHTTHIKSGGKTYFSNPYSLCDTHFTQLEEQRGGRGIGPNELYHRFFRAKN